MISSQWADGRRQVSVARRQSSVVSRLTAFCLLLTAFFAFALSQAVSTSPTFDEGFTLLRGYAAWRTGHLVPIGHPPLAHWLSALGVVLEPNLPDPRTLDGWYADKYDDSSRDLLWKRGLNTSRLVLLGRFPIILLGMLLGAVTFRWAKDLFGWRGALAALALHALSPNLLANSAVATTDLPVTAFYFFTLFAWHRFTRKPTAARAAFTGLMLGCALAAKFSALLLIPTLGLLAIIGLFTTKAQKLEEHKEKANLVSFVPSRLRGYLLILLTSLFTLWAMYGFALRPYPLAQFVRELTDLGALAGGGHTAYLFGQLSPKGWWYYHPVVFLVKTPPPLLILIAIGLWRVVGSGKWEVGSGKWEAFSGQQSAYGAQPSTLKLQDSTLKTHPSSFIVHPSSFILHRSSFILPPLLYLAAATLSSLNVGYRYLLPALPFLHLIASAAVSGQWTVDGRQPSTDSRPAFSIRHFAFVIFLWHAIATLSIAPHFLAYFNELVGPANGYKVLSDSNLDWGQDLPALAHYLNGRPVYLSYFGQADPHYYKINSTPLPGWPPPADTHFAPADPAPGLYAISASNLVGAQLPDPNTFAYFRALQPQAVINYSIFIYDVTPHDPVDSFAQCAPPLLANPAALLQQPARPIVFNCATSLIQPAHTGLALYPAEVAPLLDLGAPVFEWKRSDGTTYYRLYNSRAPALPHSPIASGSYLSLLSYDLTPAALTLRWRVEQPAPPPVSIFVHFNWPDGALADAYDALGVPAEYWQPGDIITQRHPIAPDLPSGAYGVEVGLYSLADGTRYSDIALTTFVKP